MSVTDLEPRGSGVDSAVEALLGESLFADWVIPATWLIPASWVTTHALPSRPASVLFDHITWLADGLPSATSDSAAVGAVPVHESDREESPTDPVASLHSLRAELLDVMTRMNDAITGLPLALATDDEVGAVLLDLVEVHRRVEAAMGDVAGRLASSSLWSAEGCRSPRDWIRRHTNDGSGDAARPFDAATWLMRYPAMAAAWRSGSVSRRHLHVLAEAHRLFPRLSPALLEIEGAMTECAKGLDPTRFGRTLLRTLQHIDPDAVDDAGNARRRDSIGLHVNSLPDGTVRVDGLLPAEIGAQLIAALAAARDTLRDRAESAEAERFASCRCTDAGWCAHAEAVYARKPSPSEAAPPDAVPRMSSRNVEALGLVLDAAAAAEGDLRLPDVSGERPVVHITVDSQSLIDRGSGAAGWIESLTGTEVTPITATAAQRLSCDAVAQLLVLNPAGHLDAISAKWRITPSLMRRTILVRDAGQCRFPGCFAPVREVHHIRHWAQGGPTTSGNLIGLCSHHHHLVHEGGWSISGDPNDTVTFTGSNGRPWRSPPPQRVDSPPCAASLPSPSPP